jgi:hypothetical protein
MATFVPLRAQRKAPLTSEPDIVVYVFVTTQLHDELVLL